MPFMEFLQPEHIASYLTLTFLEIVLAGDNLVLISILASRLPEHQRPLARRIGLLFAVATRLLLLFTLFWLSHIETPIKLDALGGSIPEFTVRQLIFAVGGAFLIWKALVEIRAMLTTHVGMIGPNLSRAWGGAFAVVILQIAIFDIIFSLDSVIAAIGIAQHIEVMVAAVLTATLVMFVLVNPISYVIERFPTIKLVALNFLVLIGALLVAEAGHVDVPRSYFYVALAIAIATQIVYLWMRQMGVVARIIFGAFLLALIGAAAASWQNVDLSPFIGEPAANAIRTIVETVKSAIEWMQQRLAKI